MNRSAFDHIPTERLRVVVVAFLVVLSAILIRLVYWQVIRGPKLRAEAKSQYERLIISQGRRGTIKTADGYTVATTEQRYRLFIQPHLLAKPIGEVARLVSPILVEGGVEIATGSARDQLRAIEELLVVRASKPDTKWVSIVGGLSADVRQQIRNLNLVGVGTEPYFDRAYPEASLAAHLMGFVGKNEAGEDTGYFGIEGALNRELSGQFDRQILPTVLPGLRLPANLISTRPQDGREITLTIRRDLQYLVEQELKNGVERYGAKAGEVIIMQPQTGKILAMAASPSYDPQRFVEFDAQVYKNPSVSSGYEPGSTFKTLTVAAGIDAGVISPETTCPQCDGPRQIAGYTLKTWNNQYNPNITMTEALAKSDNTAMIYIAELLGANRLQGYLKDFGIGQETGIELQEDTSPPFPNRWGPVELATISFGQGVSTTSLQVLKAVAAIANQGQVMRPLLVEEVEDVVTGEVMRSEPIPEARAIKPETAQLVTQMMVNAAQKGEAQWTASNDHWIAAKTGTSQVPVDGGYAADRTIASFVGFAPPNDPQFVMLVKLVEPTTSPWAAETAAPLWYRIAKKTFLLMNIPPDKPRTSRIETQLPPDPVSASPSAAIESTPTSE